MRNALYPKRFGDTCPYCGGEQVRNVNDLRPTADGLNVEVNCTSCRRVHRLNYRAVSVTLENENDIADTDFYYPVAELQDQGVDDPDTVPPIPVGVYAGSDGIMILAAGYGDGSSAVGYGAPVLIEHFRGSLRVVVWGDGNDDSSHTIDLGSARHSEREPEPDYPMRASRHTPDGVLIEEHMFEKCSKAKAFAKDNLSDLPGHFAQVRDINSGKVKWDSRMK